MSRPYRCKLIEPLTHALKHPWAPIVIVLIGVLLVTPSLTVGLVADDWLMELFLSTEVRIAGFHHQPLDLFTFASGDPTQMKMLVDTGVFPWWTDTSSKLSFFRPLTSLTHGLDHRLFGDHGLPMHLHSVAWFGLTLVVVGWTYRHFLGRKHGIATATFALLLYALDDAHGPAVGWVANRNAMITTTLGLCILVCHDRWRREGWRPGAILGPVLFALALTAGEAALGALAYLLAHAAHLDRGTVAARVRALSGHLLVLVIYAGSVRALGYGVHGSDLYVDPLGQPWRFATALAQRAPTLLLGQLALPWSDVIGGIGILWPDWAWPLAITSALASGGLLWILANTLHRNQTVRFFATGMILSCIPIAGTFPADRLLWWVGIGAMAWIALFVAEVMRGIDRRTSARILAGALVIIHGGLAPFFLMARSRSMAFAGRPLATANATLPADPDVVDKTFVLINPPNDAVAAFLLVQREANDVYRPRRLRWLAVGSTAVDLHRIDARTLVVRQRGGFYGQATERMLRSITHPFAPGDTIPIEGMQVTIQAITPDGRPSMVQVRFDRPLEDPGLVWAKWGDDGFVPYILPAVGESDHVPAVDQFKMMGLR